MTICTRTRRSLSAWPRYIDPTKTPEQVLEELEQDHPQPDQLLQSFRDTFNG